MSSLALEEGLEVRDSVGGQEGKCCASMPPQSNPTEILTRNGLSLTLTPRVFFLPKNVRVRPSGCCGRRRAGDSEEAGAMVGGRGIADIMVNQPGQRDLIQSPWRHTSGCTYEGVSRRFTEEGKTHPKEGGTISWSEV